MWLFSKERTAFPYEVDATSDETVGEWILRPCKNTKTGAACSAWVLECGRGGSADASALERGKAVIKRMKTLRHPNFITYIDSHETNESVTLITEAAVPLLVYLRRDSDSGNLTYLTSWGLYQVSKGLDFFNKDIKLQHNNVRLSSIFVTPAGDWKLGGLDFVQPVSDPLPVVKPSLTTIYWPSDKKRVDSWGLGCLIWEVYNSGGLNDPEQLRFFGNIPQALVPQYNELIHPKAMRRISVSEFLARATSSGGFFDNFYVKTLLFLEEIQIKDKEEKLSFLAGLADKVNTFPDDVAKYKILPHLMHFLQYGGAGAEVLTPLLRLGKLLETSEFEEKVLPCLVKLFSSPDRATRVRLLEQLPTFVEHLPEKCVNEQIFPPVSQGFIDTNPVVREATIRAMVSLSEKLSSKILNDTLPRSLTQLQVKDEQGGIRANATICLVKVAGRMSAKTRQGPLLNTFLKCTRDPYPPARRMAVTALATTLPFYTLKDTACKVLPCLAFLTVDPVQEVRDETFKSINAALARLEKASADSEVAEMEDRVANAGTSSSEVASVASAAGSAALAWTNWAVSALSAKFAKSNVSAVGDKAAEKATPSTKTPPNELTSAASVSNVSGNQDSVPNRGNAKPASSYNWDGVKGETGSSGWDDGDFQDAREDVEEAEGSWVDINSVGMKAESKTTSASKDWNSDNFFDEISSSSSDRKKIAALSASSSVSSTSSSARGAMKLGKKLGSSNRPNSFQVQQSSRPVDKDDLGMTLSAEHKAMSSPDDWSSWPADTKKVTAPSKNLRASPSNDWNSWSTETTMPAATESKNSRASPSSDGDSVQLTGSKKAASAKNAWASPSDDDWGSSWSSTDTKKGAGAPKNARASPSNDDWGSSWSTDTKKGTGAPKNARASPSNDDWGSSWSTSSKKDTQKGRKVKSSDGWDAW